MNRQDVLQAITEEYQYLRYYEGAVILALECANAADPSGAGFTWFQEGMSDKDERGKTAYQKRIKTYSNIIRVLDELHTGAFTGLVTDRSVPRPTLDTTELENEKLKVIKVLPFWLKFHVANINLTDFRRAANPQTSCSILYYTSGICHKTWTTNCFNSKHHIWKYFCASTARTRHKAWICYGNTMWDKRNTPQLLLSWLSWLRRSKSYKGDE